MTNYFDREGARSCTSEVNRVRVEPVQALMFEAEVSMMSLSVSTWKVVRSTQIFLSRLSSTRSPASIVGEGAQPVNETTMEIRW